MKELYIRSLIIAVGSYCTRIKALRFLFLFLLCFAGGEGYSAVVVTGGSGGTNICSSKAIGGSAPAFTTLTNIVVTEGLNADLSGPGTDVLVLNAPTGWVFNTVTLPSVNYITGSNIVPSPAFTITATSITITIPTNGTNGSDQFSISGLQVQATSTSSAAGYIYPSSAVGIAGITTGSAGTNFANLSLTSPLTPSVSIGASPSGPVCPGINVLFSPTPVNGGATPVYQWYLNGTSVVTGATYSNNSLVNGNTVSCVMTASGTCFTSTTATSNVYTVTVTSGPLPVTGATVTCPGTTISLSDNTVGGTWSSNNTGIATTDASGNVTGVSVGTATISYTSGSCASTANITVNYPPATPVITTTVATMCSGDVSVINAVATPLPSTVLSQTFNSGLGTWTVDNSGSIGTLTGSGWKVCGDGYVNEQGLYHSLDNSAFAMSNADTSPSTSHTSSKLISPVFSLAGYIGATLTFQQAYEYWPAGDTNVSVQISTDGGGSWSTLQNYVGSNVGNRTSFVAETFSLNAYLGQTNLRLRFYYYCHWGYYWAVDNIQVTGTSSVIIPVWSPTTFLYTDAAYTTPYTGTALNTVYVHPSSISYSGAITYTATAVSTGCSSTNTSIVNFTPTPAAINGTGFVCIGATTNLSDATSGGTWSSNSTGIATVTGTAGVVTGVASGTATITYMLGTGCYTTTVVTVNSLPATISGTRGICIGATTSLSDATAGGTWISSNTGVATIGSSTGFVTSVAAGTANITYTLGTGCNAISPVTVNPLPAAITGNTTVCMGSTTTLSDPNSGGTWSSGSTGIATVGSSTGTVTGVAGGSAMITYTLGTGCITSTQVSVNPIASITGTGNVCANSSTTLSNSIAGGTWSSNNTSVATVGTSSGIVTGVAGGVTIISYTLPTGCVSTTIFTVNPLPASITGTMQVCVGLNTNLTDVITGGTWSSALTGIATVGSTGIVHGVAQGSTTIKYTLSTGCFITTTVTVNPLPQPISGTTNVCAGSSTTLSDINPGGTWLSNNSSIATVSSAGTVLGVAAGTTTITYTLLTTCIITTAFTVNPLPVAITGSSRVCNGLTTHLSDGTSGGTWTSSNSSVATIGSLNGILSGIAQGTAMITYKLGTGCLITTVITVDPIPGTIDGNVTICNGASTTLSNSTTGGTWTSGTTAVATVGSASGIVSGVSGGTSVITYLLSTGCIATVTVTVNPLPNNISGLAAVCQGATTSLSDGSPGGTWSSGNTAVGTIGSLSGIVTGISAGTTAITYLLNTGCMTITTVTVSALPAAISGSNNVCLGAITALSDAVSGGTWSSSNTSNAVVGSTTGSVVGVAIGTAIISYTIPVSGGIGCSTAVTVTVNPLPSGITGPSNVCTGATINLTNTTTGGAWSSNNTSIATIGSTGILSGIAAGPVTITYALPTGCSAIKSLNVNQTPGTISGAASVCEGATISLSDANTGGTWTSSNTTAATIGSATGTVNGLVAGTTNITYTLSGGCYANSVVTVNVSPTGIIGTTVICASAATNLTDAIAGGTWSSSNTGVATVGSSSGVMNGIAPGTANITYTLSDGCAISKAVTINIMPASINGNAAVCAGSTTSLSDNVTGGTWISSNAAIAVIGSSTGTVNGLSTGTATITYGFATGCVVTTIATVNVVPGAISGSTSVCLGSAISLSDATNGGVWTSNNTGVATIGTSGIVTTVSAGAATIFYTLPTGCFASRPITVYPMPSAIGGTTNICAGTVTILTDAVTGGTWTSGNTSIATIGSSSGALTGIGSGTVTISYTFGTSCTATTVATVNLLPSSISGNQVVCVASTTTLSDPIGGGGTWSSGDISIATVGSGTGVVTGVASGVVPVTYSLGVGCTLAAAVTVNPLPASITQSTDLCYGSTAVLSDAITGGTWSSSNTAIATIGSSSGFMNGIAAGTVNITYQLGTGCLIATTVTVYPLPAAISGTVRICAGLTTSLSDASAGGTWSSSSLGIATVGSGSGIVNGIAAGTATITYTLGTGCFISVVVTVNPLPSAISGNNNVCAGLTTNLTDVTGGGTWTSSNNSVATIGSTSGIVNGIITGTSSITYTLSTGCISTTILTVFSLPSAINGTTNVCEGLSVNLSDATSGGTWSSSNTSVATIDISGNVTGIVAGTTIITYTVGGTGCSVATPVTVNPLPAAIIGIMSTCVGSATALSDASASGVWSSSDVSIASVGSSSGVVSGIGVGTAVVTYTLGTGCLQTSVVNIDPLPSSIMGTGNMCVGFSTNLTDAASGGTWSSGDITIATVGSGSGIVTGIAAGTAIITYTLPTSCYTIAVVTVNPLPLPISGAVQVCEGSTTTLSDASPGGTWASSILSVATVGSGTGIVSGVLSGVTIITYMLPTGCIITSGVTVDALPAAITGVTNVCVGLTTALSTVATGGVWSVSGTGIASIDVAGIVTGISSGTATVTYMLGTSCFTTIVITVNPLPAAITGASNICVGLTASLGDVTTPGTWSSSNGAIASVGAATGIVAGISAGTVSVTYTLLTGCLATTGITVSPLPAAITGSGVVCVGLNITLSDAIAGGTWTSGSTAIATIGSANGIVMGIVSGTSGITYTLSTGCIATTTITVDPLPSGITGSTHVCVGSTINLTDATGSGTWSSGAIGTASVNSSGVVTGISAGTAIITYTLPTGCLVTTTVTIDPLPSAITGVSALCTGNTTTLTDATSGGTWSTTATGIVSVGSVTGIVNALAAGTAMITYALPTGCITTITETVFASPSSMSGSSAVCAGATINLTDATSSGSWISSNTSVASVSSTGIVAGITAGTSVITYSLGSGCFAVKIITVNPLPSAISGTTAICTGRTATLSDAITGGNWSMNAGSSGIATIGPFTGFVTAIASGSATVSYILSTGCYVTMSLTVNPSPAPITGIAVICAGLNTSLSDITASGVWTSSNSAIANVGTSSGIVSGASAGTATISYTLSTGCFVTTVYTVNPLPATIAGNRSVCIGSIATLSDALTGGIWSMAGAAGIASIGSVSGVVSGIALGTGIVTYTLPTGCFIHATITVNPYPAVIAGVGSVCQGSIIVLSDATSGGTWGSSNVAVATVNALSGAVAGVSGGNVTISYTLPTGCYLTKAVTVNPIFPITGSMSICAGATNIFSDLITGGTWTSSNGTVATINASTGNATAIASGTTIISYLLSTGCSANVIVTVTPAPASFMVIGGGNYCAGSPSGIIIGLNGSEIGVNYRLYRDTSFIISKPGTDSAIYYGPYTTLGSYTIVGVNTITGCSNTMAGTATIGIAPLLVPSVSITTTAGDTVCAGAHTIFTALPVNGGSSPVYRWYKNNVLIAGATSNTYGYTPLAGDIVSVRLTSNAPCAVPDTARSSFSVITAPNLTPSLSIVVTPGDSLCAHVPVTVIPSAVNGGTSPSYRWIKNGTTASFSNTYNYTPANGDNVTCVLHSNYRCLTIDSVFSSNNIHFTVVPYLTPSVTISAYPGTTIISGQADTLVATVSNGGPVINYQWNINGVAISGATSDTFRYSNFNNSDTVACIVNSNNLCGGIPDTAETVVYVSNVGVLPVIPTTADIRLMPNPNNGDFVIKGFYNNSVSEQMPLEVIDILGQVVYHKQIQANQGKIYEIIQLPASISNGVYLVRISSPASFLNWVSHFTIRK